MKTDGPAIPDAALEADIAILGKKGRGKTYVAKGCVERLLTMGRRVIVLDPLSTWWGLKAGDHAFPIPVLGGPHADLAITDRDGAALGRHLATSGESAVIDLGAMRKAELVRFATPFLEELYTLNREALWLALEEADVFAPQNPFGDAAQLLGEVDRIARRGRQFGFRLITLTQRPARLHKDVLTQLSTLIVLGITSPHDRDAIQAWVEGNADRNLAKEVVATLASLKVGEGWVWAPDLDLLKRVSFPRILTLDTSATPRAGEKRDIGAMRGGDVGAILAALAPAREAARVSTKRRLSAQADSATPIASNVTAEAIAAAEARGYARAEAQFRAWFQRGYESAVEGLIAVATKQLERPVIVAALESNHAPRQPPSDVPHALQDGRAPHGALRGERRSTHRRGDDISASRAALPFSAPDLGFKNGSTLLDGAAPKMLAVLDTNPPIRRTWLQIATLAGIKAHGGHFNRGRKSLIDGGHVTSMDGLVAIAAPSAGALPAVTDPGALVETWSKVLTDAAPGVVRILFSSGGALPRDEIARRLSIKPFGGHWNRTWKQLRDNGIVTLVGDIATLSELFSPARRKP